MENEETLTEESTVESLIQESEVIDYTEQFQTIIEQQERLLEAQETQGGHLQVLSEGETIDYSLVLDSINDKLMTVIDNQEQLLLLSDVISLSSSSIITYAVFYVPLVALVCAGWWFFKQFIR